MEGAIDGNVIVIGAAIAPLLAILINPLKGRLVPSDLMIYVAIVVGVAWTLVFHWTQSELAKETIMASIVLGVTTGVAATGSYDLLSTARDRNPTVERLATRLTLFGNGEDGGGA